MTIEAQEYAKLDEEAAVRIGARNHFETYAYELQDIQQYQQEKLNLGPLDKRMLETAVTWAFDFMASSDEVSKEEYEQKESELRAFVKPIAVKLGFRG